MTIFGGHLHASPVKPNRFSIELALIGRRTHKIRSNQISDSFTFTGIREKRTTKSIRGIGDQHGGKNKSLDLSEHGPPEPALPTSPDSRLERFTDRIFSAES